jgi:hypothetical protein
MRMNLLPSFLDPIPTFPNVSTKVKNHALVEASSGCGSRKFVFLKQIVLI